MAKVVALRAGENPPPGERHALVISSAKPPAEGSPIVDHPAGRTFFAADTARDIVVITGRAMVWADQQRILNVYLRHES